MSWKSNLEYADLIPMALSDCFIDILNGVHHIDNLELYQGLGKISSGFFLYSTPNAILSKYYRVGALEFGLNQLYLLRQNLKEEMRDYVARHSQYFQMDYQVNEYDRGPFYTVSFLTDCSNNCQYLFDVIHELAKEMKWNRPIDFLDISGVPFICQYDKIYYDEEQLAIVLESPAKQKVFQQKKRPIQNIKRHDEE